MDSPIERPGAGAAHAASPGTRRRFELLEECRVLLLGRLSAVIAEALGRLGDDLTAEALKATRSEEQRALLDAVMMVRENRSAIETGFRRSFGDLFERRLFCRSAPASASPAELALVSDEVVQDQVTVERLSGRARSRLDPDEVLGVRARLGALLERDWFEESEHPASPQAIFEALKLALAELAPNPRVRTALLDAFEPYVTTNLNAIYGSVNERLVAHHVLPTIRREVRRQTSRQQTPHVRPAPMRENRQAPEAFAAAAPPAPVREDATREHALHLLADATALGSEPATPPPAPLLDALSRMQRELGAARGDPQQSVAHVPLPALIERAVSHGSLLDQVTVEIVAVVFDYVWADPRLPEAVREQLMRLPVVAVKAALLDRSFFARRAHPMRRLIDRISELGADPDIDTAAGASFVAGLAELIGRLLVDFDDDLEAFEDAIEQVDELAREEALRRIASIEAIAAETQRREAVALAEDEARAALGQRMDRDTPAFVREFLYRWWTVVLAHARTAAADPASAWDEALRSAEYLLWSVTPKHGDDVSRLASILPRMIRSLAQGVASVPMPSPERERFFDELLEAHTRQIASAKRRMNSPDAPRAVNAGLRLDSDGRVRFPARPRSAPADDSPATVSAAEAALEGLGRGRRIEILETGGRWTAYKLGWVSPARRLFVLTRHPDAATTLAGADLAAMLAADRARVLDDAPASERALAAVRAAGDPARTPAAGGLLDPLHG